MKENVVIITGCSTGIGRNLAQTLFARGYRVVATARRLETIKDIPAALHLELDVTKQASVDAAISQTLTRLGRIDYLVNNAGHSVRAAIEDMDEKPAREMFDVNLWGLIRVTRAVLPHMRKRKAGRIIHVGSVVGKFTMPINGAYSASKHAVEAIANAMRVELKPFNIQVVLIEPGTINTQFMSSSIAKSQEQFDNSVSPYAKIYERFRTISAHPARKGALPKEVSQVIVRAMEAKHPKARYLAAVGPLYRAILIMNDRLRDSLMAKLFLK
ncbi:MAG: SDR family oxidoreductase [Deltaproteobacteria bacterium]|nr:SDR family oxidoreductase [Deltaproteobacteria bacterium]